MPEHSMKAATANQKARLAGKVMFNIDKQTQKIRKEEYTYNLIWVCPPVKEISCCGVAGALKCA